MNTSEEVKRLEESTFTTPDRLWLCFNELLDSHRVQKEKFASMEGAEEAFTANAELAEKAQKVLEFMLTQFSPELKVAEVSIVTLFVVGTLGTSASSPEAAVVYASMLDRAVQGTLQIGVTGAVQQALSETLFGKPPTH